MAKPDFLVVGAGFAGAVCAERLASAGFSVTVIERRGHVGGNCYDEVNEAGIREQRYGAHIFHTNSAVVFDYLSQFTNWRPYEHHVLSAVGDRLVPFPIIPETVEAFGGDLEAARSALMTGYTRKQWGRYTPALDASVQGRVAPRDTNDRRYFRDRFQAMPEDGYTALILRLLSSPNIRVRVNIDWFSFSVTHRSVVEAAKGIIVTSPIDQFYEFAYGGLPYRSARFEFVTIRNVARVLPAPVVNYADQRVPYTRVAEFTQITGQSSPHTTLAWEYPTDEGDPYWPVLTERSRGQLEQYRALAATQPTVHFCGRLGSFQYLNIDQTVAQALKLSERLIATAHVQETV